MPGKMIATMAYNTIQPPFTLKFRDMSKKELRDYYRWFREVIPERITELAGAVKSSPGFEDWRADYTPTSLNALGSWFATQIQTCPRTQEETEEIAAQSLFPRSSQELTNRTISLAMDIAMYLSQVLLRNNPSLRWDQLFGNKKFIEYGQPVLVGFVHETPINPVGAMTTLAYGLVRKTKTGRSLRETYDKLHNQVHVAESR